MAAVAAAERVPAEEIPPLTRRRCALGGSGTAAKWSSGGCPADVSKQEVQEMLCDFELQHCFVDRHSGTASITLSDAAAAERALQRLQRCTLRRHRLHAEVQPCSALLCVAHLPRHCSQQPWEALVRPYGAVGRCWLVHSRASGRCKGYGFVEYLHEEAAAAAQAELQGRALGAQVLFVRRCDAGGELMEEEDLHSRCLCVEGLPRGYTDGEGLRRVFSGVCGPKFCQLACGPDGQPLGFAVLEFDSADAAERVQAAMDGALVGSSRVCVSFCAPGLPGHKMLPALVAVRTAAQSRGRGLLPDPTLLQILSALRSPTAAPLLHGALGGKRGLLGAAPLLPFCPTVLQSVLQNPMRKPGLLGEAPLRVLPHGVVGMPTVNAAPLLGDTATGGDVPPCPPLGGVPVVADRDGPLLTASLLGPTNRRSAGAAPSPAGSLLGEPPKDFRIPRNPYLNLRSLLPPSITGIAAPQALALPPHSILGTGPTARISSALREPLLPSPGATTEGTPIVPPTLPASHSAPPKTPVPPPPKRTWSQLLPPPRAEP
ncbi:ribonucleoprotein PTB-binding 1 isoform X2 [Lagopus muta]|uniref:ribonucleoprotein PTB-binding 1 isoform X2 n=1 Tax=Lagopus muta TaxID=64668 RepID=UPI0020A19004|nr:ribonucleoprotein PTB-binding 1 isoform X2 [Lagopus muta]